MMETKNSRERKTRIIRKEKTEKIKSSEEIKKEKNEKTNRSVRNIRKREKKVRVENFEFKKSKLKIIPLGGLHEIGKNITVFEYENEMIVVDCV